MAMEQGSEKVGCDMAEANLATAGGQLRRSIALRDGPKAGPPVKVCRLIGENGSELTWRQGGFFILAMLRRAQRSHSSTG